MDPSQLSAYDFRSKLDDLVNALSREHVTLLTQWHKVAEENAGLKSQLLANGLSCQLGETSAEFTVPVELAMSRPSSNRVCPSMSIPHCADGENQAATRVCKDVKNEVQEVLEHRLPEEFGARTPPIPLSPRSSVHSNSFEHRAPQGQFQERQLSLSSLDSSHISTAAFPAGLPPDVLIRRQLSAARVTSFARVETPGALLQREPSSDTIQTPENMSGPSHEKEDSIDSPVEVMVNLGSRRAHLWRGISHSSLEEVSKNRKLRLSMVHVVQGPYFQHIAATMVIFNAVSIGIETDHMSTEVLDRSPFAFRILNIWFCLAFITEIIMRAIAYGRKFLYGREWRWHILDSILVSLQAIDVILVEFELSSEDFSLNLSFLRLLRLLRLVRIIRLIRVLEFIHELRTIVASIMGSVRSLLWTIVLLFMVVYVSAIFFTQQVLDHRVTMRHEIEVMEDEQLFLLFGTLPRSILTLFQSISGGIDWNNITSPLMTINTTLAFLFSIYIAACVFAFLNVVTGVFVESALESAKEDRTSYMLQHVKQLFENVDPDVDDPGSLGWERFESHLQKRSMREFFDAIDVDIVDAKSVFALLDTDDSGEVDMDEFLNGCLGLHGPAKAIHLATLMYESRISQRFHAQHLCHIERMVNHLGETLHNGTGPQRLPLPRADSSIAQRRAYANTLGTSSADVNA